MESLSSDHTQNTKKQSTRDALMRVALERFGSKGFEAASTRDIAKLANANIAAITYHFGSKEGLRNACASFIAETMFAMVGGPLGAESEQTSDKVKDASDRLDAMIDAMVNFVVANETAEPIARFMMREQMQPSSAFDIIYARVMAPVHMRLCQIWADATGTSATSDATKLSTLTLFGQVLYFRIGRPAVLRRMQWDTIGTDQANAIRALIKRNMQAMLRAAREEVT